MEKYKDIMKSLIQYYRIELETVLSHGDISHYCYKKAVDKSYGTYDANYTNRLRLSLTILYSPEIEKSKLESLIRKLYMEELKDRETNSFQGIGTVLEVLSILLKEYGRIEDLKLFERAKNANFDCACGFEAGFPKYRRNIYDLDLFSCIYMADDLYEEEVLSSLIDEWIYQEREWNLENLKDLCRLEKLRKNSKGEIIALEKIADEIKDSSDHWQICSLLHKYSRKLIDLKEYKKAWGIIKELRPHLYEVYEDWYNVNLGRDILEDCMDLIISKSPEIPINEIWSWSKPFIIKAKKNMHWDLYEKAALASQELGNLKLSKKLIKMLDKEKKELYS